MREEICWLIGFDPETDELYIVEGRRVGDHDGSVTVDIRPHCSSSMLVTVENEKVFLTKKDAVREMARRLRGRQP